MGKQLTEDELRTRLLLMCVGVQQKEVAEKLGVSAQYFGDVLKRGKPIASRLAQAMGYRRVVRFEEVQDNGNE